MPYMKDVLQLCSLVSLKDCACNCGLPYKANSRADIIARLKGADDYDVLGNLDKSSLVAICDEYDLPRSGNKNDLVDRMWEILYDAPERSGADEAWQKCMMCDHKYHRFMMHKHHFVRKSISTYAPGWILLCGNCHSLWHHVERETGQELDDVDEVQRLFERTKKDVKEGKYSRK